MISRKNREIIADRAREARKKKGWTQKQLAAHFKHLGISERQYKRLEQSHEQVSIEFVLNVAKHLGFPVSDLFPELFGANKTLLEGNIPGQPRKVILVRITLGRTEKQDGKVPRPLLYDSPDMENHNRIIRRNRALLREDPEWWKRNTGRTLRKAE